MLSEFWLNFFQPNFGDFVPLLTVLTVAADHGIGVGRLVAITRNVVLRPTTMLTTWVLFILFRDTYPQFRQVRGVRSVWLGQSFAKCPAVEMLAYHR